MNIVKKKIQIKLNNKFHKILSKEFPESKCLLNFPEKKALLKRMPGNKNESVSQLRRIFFGYYLGFLYIYH